MKNMKRMNTKLRAIFVALTLGAILVALPGTSFAANQAVNPTLGAVSAQPNCFYMVRRGDTLSGIAARYGTNFYALAAMNGLYNPNWIYAGMVLRVPCGGVPNPPSGICNYYLVRRGDYLKLIAARFGTTWQAIAQVNRLYNPNLIYPGMRLAIPCGSAPPPETQQWRTFTSIKHHYVVNYPAAWIINVQNPESGRDPEYLYLSPSGTGLPHVQILALKDQPPITGFENCNRNMVFRGVPACSLSLPKAQIPATQLLIFQRGESYYHISFQYETQQQLGVFDEIVRSFQFTP